MRPARISPLVYGPGLWYNMLCPYNAPSGVSALRKLSEARAGRYLFSGPSFPGGPVPASSQHRCLHRRITHPRRRM